MFWLVSLVLLPVVAQAEGIVRFYCSAESEGAVLFIDGKQKGSCPGDLFLPSGRYTVTAIKGVDAEYERRFEQAVVVSETEPLRVRVELSAPQLSKAAAQKREALARAEQASKRQQALQDDIAKAEAGEPAAIQAMIRRFSEGDGVKRDLVKVKALKQRLLDVEQAEAEQLRQQADAGNASAMRQLAQRYRDGRGVEKNAEQAAAWDVMAKQAEMQAQAKAQADTDLAQFTFVPTFYKFMESDISKSFGEEMDGGNMLAITTSIYPWAASGTVASLTDLISLPFNLTSYQQLKKKAVGHAAAWHEPDSLMARAYARHGESPATVLYPE